MRWGAEGARVATFAVGRRGVQVAARIARQLRADTCVAERWGQLAEASSTRQEAGGDGRTIHTYPNHGLATALREAFGRYRGLVLIMPLGIAVRLLAPSLQDKRADPAVVVVDEAGRHAIALLSGHLGGANALAQQVAAAIGAQPIVTTASEVLDTLALDLLGHEWGWTIDDPAGLTRASAALINGEPVGAYQDAGEEQWWQQAPAHLVRYSSLTALDGAPLAARLVISDRVGQEARGNRHGGTGGPAPADGDARAGMTGGPVELADAPVVVYRPRTLVVGVGCVRGASAAEIEALVDAALHEGALAAASVRELATIDRKRDEAGLIAFAQRRGWPVRYFSGSELAATPAPSGGSAVVQRAVGAPAVCEPAALRAAGATRLVVSKMRTARVTVAIARCAPHPIAGQLTVVGIGPGDAADLTARARAALESADAIVGYHGYLDLVRPWLGERRYHGSEIGDEAERCRLAISLARAGQAVALVSSGDAGIYGMAGLVFELLEQEGDMDLAGAVTVVPGVSAAQAAAALLGAPLTSDFVAISLSDLLTPWSTIEARLQAAAVSDLVVALYNPASQRRRGQLARAREILLAHRPPETPVGLVRNARRPGQTVQVTDLAGLLEHPVDMLTMVIVGNRATIRVGDRLTTRRGYAVHDDAHARRGEA